MAILAGTFAGTTSASLSGITAGDLLVQVIYVTSGAGNVVPPAPSGWTSLGGGTSNTSAQAIRVCYMTAAGGETTSGTTSNAARVVVMRFQPNQAGGTILARAIGTFASTSGTTVNFVGPATAKLNNYSRYVAVHLSLNSSLSEVQAVPTSAQTTFALVDAIAAVGTYISDAIGANTFSGSLAASKTVTSGQWEAASFEISDTTSPATYSSGTGSAAGVATVAGVGRVVVSGVGAASGVATVAGVGFAVPAVPTGFAAGTSTANAPGMSIAAGVGHAAGVATALAPTVVYGVGIGTAAGKATVHGAHYKPSRIIVGRLPSDAYGMRVSIPGYDASAHPVDDQKLIFSSEWPDVMPIHARGSFVHRGEFTQGFTETQEIDMPNPLGYVPFCDFTVRGMGNAAPAGTDLYPADRYYPYGAISLPYWDGSGNVTTSGDANAYLRLNVTATKICARSFVRWLSSSSSTQGIPRQWVIYYTIYRKQAS